jgi:hypothetical protein
MKVKVNRALLYGLYHVNFEVGNFSVEEVTKMEKFGVPMISMVWNTSGGSSAGKIPLNKISPGLDAVFATEEQAIGYEQTVMNQIKAAVEALRAKKDEYSRSSEFEL